ATESAAGAFSGTGGVMGAGGSGGASVGRDSGLADAVADVVADVANPVPDAMAQDGGGQPQSVAVDRLCETMGPNGTRHAVLEIAGSVDELSEVRGLLMIPPGSESSTNAPDGFEALDLTLFYRSGSISGYCGGSPVHGWTARFIVPA